MRPIRATNLEVSGTQIELAYDSAFQEGLAAALASPAGGTVR
jgi:hypothetical protein